MSEGEEVLETRSAIQLQYGDLYDILLEIFFRHDPLGINFGGNTDEYDPEVRTIIPRIAEADSPATLCRIIHQEFARWFGRSGTGDVEDYQALAQEVWQTWRPN